MTAHGGPVETADAELVAGVLAADQQSFATVYDRYGPRLFDFAYSMLRQREDASDAVADAFVIFAERLHQLRDPDRLRPWLYAIVRTECLRRLKARKRFSRGDDEDLGAMADQAPTPEEATAETDRQASLRQLVWEAAGGLADRDRAILDLHLRQGLDGAELAEAIGTTPSNAYVLLSRLRDQVERSLGALMVARLGRKDCAGLDGLLGAWDGRLSPLIRKRVARHVDGCTVCSVRRSNLVSPTALLASVPVFAVPVALRDRVLEDFRLVSARTGPGPGSGPGAPAGRGPRGRRDRRGPLRRISVLLLLLGLVVGAVLLLDPGLQRARLLDEPIAVETMPGEVLSPAPAAPTTPAPAPVATPTDLPTPVETGPTVAPTATPDPGQLTVSRSAVDLGSSGTRTTVRLGNSGGTTIHYRLAPGAGWLSAGPASGDLSPGAGTTVTITVDRSGLREGDHATSLGVAWNRGTRSVSVSLSKEVAPVVGAPRVPTGASCDVTISAAVSDPGGLSRVTLHWSGPASGSVAMSPSWTATVHVSLGGSYTFWVTATDARGNTATGPRVTRVVNPCPQ